MINLKFITSALAIAAVSVSFYSHAENVYRWKDDNGRTHFSSQPPQDNPQKAERYNVKYQQPAEGVEGYKIPTGNENNTTETASAQSGADSKKSQDECKKARDYKSTITSTANLMRQKEDGTSVPYTDAEKAAEIKRADKLIQYYCE